MNNPVNANVDNFGKMWKSFSCYRDEVFIIYETEKGRKE